MRVARSTDTAEQMVKQLLSMIRECKKRIDNENNSFEKIGISGLIPGQAKSLTMLQEFQGYYQDVLNIRDLKNTVSENVLTTAANEYDTLHEVLKQYYVNLEIAGRVSNIFLDSMKQSIQIDARKDYGYNRNGMLISDNKILSSMPSISFNNKV